MYHDPLAPPPDPLSAFPRASAFVDAQNRPAAYIVWRFTCAPEMRIIVKVRIGRGVDAAAHDAITKIDEYRDCFQRCLDWESDHRSPCHASLLEVLSKRTQEIPKISAGLHTFGGEIVFPGALLGHDFHVTFKGRGEVNVPPIPDSVRQTVFKRIDGAIYSDMRQRPSGAFPEGWTWGHGGYRREDATP